MLAAVGLAAAGLVAAGFPAAGFPAAGLPGPSPAAAAGRATAGPAVHQASGSLTPVGFSGPATYGTGTTPVASATGDFNGDGHPDIAAVNFGGDSVSVLLNQGDGTFAKAVNYAVGAGPDAIAVGDFNGDGHLDLAVANEQASTVSVLLGRGDGTFAAPLTYAVGPQPFAVAVGTFTTSGHEDLVVANGYNATISVLLGNGDGTFAPQATYAVGTSPDSIAVGAFAGNGVEDLAVANDGSNSVSILLGRGDGTFAPQRAFAAGAGPYSVSAADLSGNGRLDLVVADESAANVDVLMGRGDGTFARAVSYPTGPYPFAAAVGDLNGDGVPDIAVANGGAGDTTVSVLLGNGDGTFAPQLGVTNVGPSASINLADLNGDGHLDMATTDQVATGSVSVFLNVPQLLSVALSAPDQSVPKGTSEQLVATGTYTFGPTQDLSARVAWSSSNPAAVTVSAGGKLTGVGTTGTTTISAVLGGVTGTAQFSSAPAALTALVVTPAAPKVAVGRSVQLTATGTFSDRSKQNVTGQAAWSSGGAAAAVTSAGGLVTGLVPGTATITAMLDGISASVPVRVSAPVLVSLAVGPPGPTLAKGTAEQLTATGTYSDGSTSDLTGRVAWAVYGAAATVSSPGGWLSAVATGSATVTVTSAGVTGSAPVTVTAPTLSSLAVTAAASTLAGGTAEQLRATGTFTDGSTEDLTGQVAWSSSDPAVVTVTSPGGSARALAAGSATLSATLSGVTGSTVLGVTAAALATLAVTPADPSVAVGATAQLTATGTFTDGSTEDLTGQVVWWVSGPATVSSPGGLVTGEGTGTAQVLAMLGGVSASDTVTVVASHRATGSARLRGWRPGR